MGASGHSTDEKREPLMGTKSRATVSTIDSELFSHDESMSLRCVAVGNTEVVHDARPPLVGQRFISF